MSTDVYCQITNYATPMFFTQTERREKGKLPERQRESVCERRSVAKTELASVVKQLLEEGLAILRFLGILT